MDSKKDFAGIQGRNRFVNVCVIIFSEHLNFISGQRKLQIITKFFKTQHDVDFEGWRVISNVTSPQQVGDKDCGVFACQFVKCVVLGISSFKWSPKDVQCLRQMMIMEFFFETLRGGSLSVVNPT